jgi:hypothetical protein
MHAIRCRSERGHHARKPAGLPRAFRRDGQRHDQHPSQEVDVPHLEFLLGEGRLVAPKTVEVRLATGGTRTLAAEPLFLNLGTHAAVPDVPGAQSDRIGGFTGWLGAVARRTTPGEPSWRATERPGAEPIRRMRRPGSGGIV